MGKFIRKSKGNGVVAVMEVSQVGVRTRATSTTPAILEEERDKQRKLLNLENSPHVHLISRRKLIITPENVQSSDQVEVSSCSSNGSSEVVNESLRSVIDLKDSHDFGNSPYRERTPWSVELHSDSNDLESTGRPLEANSCHKSMAEKMPTDSEIEDFFSQAEKEEKRRFAEKYNFDIEKDEALEGRFEWIEVKP